MFFFDKPKHTKRKKRRKNLTPTRHQKNVETSIHKKESQVVNRVFRNESVVFQQESLQFKLDKTQLKKIFLSLRNPKRKSNAGGTTRLCVIQRKEPKNKNTWLSFSLFQLKQKAFC